MQSKLTLAERDRVEDLADSAGVRVGRVAKDNGRVKDALDVVLANDDSLEGLASLDLLGDLDTGDAGLSESEESSGSGGDGETHVDGCVKLSC
jgi:hypothetical protein